VSVPQWHDQNHFVKSIENQSCFCDFVNNRKKSVVVTTSNLELDSMRTSPVVILVYPVESLLLNDYS